MQQLTVRKVIMISETQDKTLRTLKSKYKVHPAHFIRDAINEKLQREKLQIKERVKRLEFSITDFSEKNFKKIKSRIADFIQKKAKHDKNHS